MKQEYSPAPPRFATFNCPFDYVCSTAAARFVTVCHIVPRSSRRAKVNSSRFVKFCHGASRRVTIYMPFYYGRTRCTRSNVFPAERLHSIIKHQRKRIMSPKRAKRKKVHASRTAQAQAAEDEHQPANPPNYPPRRGRACCCSWSNPSTWSWICYLGNWGRHVWW